MLFECRRTIIYTVHYFVIVCSCWVFSHKVGNRWAIKALVGFCNNRIDARSLRRFYEITGIFKKIL